MSVNTAEELAGHPRHVPCLKDAGVEVVTVESSRGNYPAYLPNLRAVIIKAASLYPGELLAITNADIHVAFKPGVSHILSGLGKAEFLMAHQSDVDDASLFHQTIDQRLAKSLNSPFLPGIDFIAARAETFKAASRYVSPALTLGLPWWDLLLPMALYAAVATRSFLDSSYFLHLKH